MIRKLAKTLVIPIALVTAGGAASVMHHGWNHYDRDRTLNLEGTVQEIAYDNPHVVIQLETEGEQARTWTSVLAPPSRMRARGLPDERLETGMTTRVIGHPHLKTAGEMRAVWIVVGNDTIDLR